MTTIRLFADDQKLTVVEGPCVVSGGRNATTLQVGFGRHWSNYEKSAVFYTSRDETVYEVLLDDGKCVIPHEVLSLTANLFIGVRGVSSERQAVKATSLVKYKIKKGAPMGDGCSVEPTPDVYQQILMRLNDLEGGADTEGVVRIVEKYLENHPPAQGTPGRDGKDGAPGKDGVPGENGKDGSDGKSAYAYAQEAGYTGTEVEFARDLVKEAIPVPETAEVGQTIVVKAVDENGKPTEWESVNLDKSWVIIKKIKIEEDVTSVLISSDSDGNPFSYDEFMIFTHTTAADNVTTAMRIRINGLSDYQMDSNNSFVKNDGCHTLIEVRCINRRALFTYGGSNGAINGTSKQITYNRNCSDGFDNIYSIAFYTKSGAGFKAGSTFSVYGKKH